MKIQLISGVPINKQIHGEFSSIYPPLGILYLASYARNKIEGLEFNITDSYLLGYKKTYREIKKFNPDVLGFSFTTPGACGSYKLINQIKTECPDIFIAVGGSHASAIPEDVLIKTKTDVIIAGEGEVTFTDIIKNLNNFRRVRGIVFKKNNRIYRTPYRKLIKNLDNVPFPARDLVDIKNYPGYFVTKKRPDTAIITTRGCPFKCTFCSNPVWRTSKPYVRFRSPKNVADEVEYLKNKFHIKEFYDHCDEFNVSIKWAENICNEYISRKLDVPWKVQIRADKLTENLVKKMKRAGCWLVNIGIESGNPKTLDGINKQITLKNVIKSCELLKKHEIKVYGLFMAFNAWEENGFKFENVLMNKKTLKFAEKLLNRNLLDYISWSLTVPYPGSKLYDIATKYDLIPEKFKNGWENWNNSWFSPMALPGISRKELIKIKNSGIKLQIKYLLKNKNINLMNAKLFFQKAFTAACQ